MSKRRKQAGLNAAALRRTERAASANAAPLKTLRPNGLPARTSLNERAGRMITPDPPRKHYGFLIGTAVGLTAWITFLVVMVMRS
jgi:hypothetical protein